jgi:hypothetical protein
VSASQKPPARQAQRPTAASDAASGGQFTPAVSRVVTYRLSAANVADIVGRREASLRLFKHVPALTGYGTVPESGEELPLLITRVGDDDRVSGHVFLNGSDTWWVQNAKRGSDRGQWRHFTDPKED